MEEAYNESNAERKISDEFFMSHFDKAQKPVDDIGSGGLLGIENAMLVHGAKLHVEWVGEGFVAQIKGASGNESIIEEFSCNLQQSLNLLSERLHTESKGVTPFNVKDRHE